MIQEKDVLEMLRLNGGRLHHREGQELEFKEQFNFAGMAEYLRDFAAFANNRGGYLVFGVQDAPRKLIGMSEKSCEQFEKIDPEQITGFIIETFSSSIDWEQACFTKNKMQFGVFHIYASKSKPVIARKNDGKDQVIKNGSVYYRYGGRTQVIQGAELEAIINHRIEKNNEQWLDLMSKIGRAGPQNAAILDADKGTIEKQDSQVLVLDKELASKIKFIKKGQFVEEDGAPALQLVGDITAVDQVEVTKRIKENLTKSYPLSAMELVEEVKKLVPSATQHEVWQCIKDNSMKGNQDYSAYNFRNKKQEDNFKNSGLVPSVTPIIYNDAAVEFIANVIRNEHAA